jgi:hypothetical protein
LQRPNQLADLRRRWFTFPRPMADPAERKVVPKYFYHVYDGDSPIVHDNQGVELPDETAAIEASERLIKSVLRDAEFADMSGGRKSFHVVDDSGRTIVVIPFE